MTNTALKAQIDSQITNETSPSTISPADVGGNLNALVDYTDQQVGIYNTCKLLLSQSGTAAPTANIARNNFSAAPTYTRVAQGKFSIIFPSGSFTSKVVICQASSSTTSQAILSINQTGANTIGLWAVDNSGVFIDVLSEISITIEAY